MEQEVWLARSLHCPVPAGQGENHFGWSKGKGRAPLLAGSRCPLGQWSGTWWTGQLCEQGGANVPGARYILHQPSFLMNPQHAENWVLGNFYIWPVKCKSLSKDETQYFLRSRQKKGYFYCVTAAKPQEVVVSLCELSWNKIVLVSCM